MYPLLAGGKREQKCGKDCNVNQAHSTDLQRTSRRGVAPTLAQLVAIHTGGYLLHRHGHR